METQLNRDGPRPDSTGLESRVLAHERILQSRTAPSPLPSEMLASNLPSALFDVRQAPFHRETDDRLQREIEQAVRWRTYRVGETVLGEEDNLVFVGQVKSGVLRLQKSMVNGRQQIVSLLFPSDMFGRFFSQKSHLAIEAATAVTVGSIGRNEFERLILGYPQLEHRMFLNVSEELDRTREWMVMLGAPTVFERIKRMLWFLHHRQTKLNVDAYLECTCLHIEIPISRRDLAACMVTTVETVCRTFRMMEKENVIRLCGRGQIEIPDGQKFFRQC